MKFSNVVCPISLDQALAKFEGRTYIRLSELGIDKSARNSLGGQFHRAGFKKFLMKMNGEVFWVWCLDKSLLVPVTADARAELSVTCSVTSK